jgi:hypothetical protein
MPAALFLRLVFWLWFAGAVAAGHWLVLARLPPLALPAVILAAAGLPLALAWRLPALRAWVESIDLRALVLLHVTRLIGLYFLWQHQQGDLPRAFVAVAGVGDVIIAVMALPVALAPLPDAARLRAIRIWSVVSFITLLLIVFTVARLNHASPLSLLVLTRLPLSLYLTFLLPLLLASQALVLLRCSAPPPPP